MFYGKDTYEEKEKKEKTALSMQSSNLQEVASISKHEDTALKVTNVDAEVIRKVEAVIYIMADKFLDSAEMEQLKEEIKMTRLGKMLYDDGKDVGERIGEERGQSKVMILIQKMSADGALADIPRLSTDPEFYKEMAKKYCVEI